MKTVLDASALLAYLKKEPGEDKVKAVLDESVISSVNWSEVVQKMIALDADISTMRQTFQAIGLTIEPFTLEDGEMAGRLWTQTKRYGLSLGDRACLALGIRLEATILTSDQAWAALVLPVEIQLVRPQPID